MASLVATRDALAAAVNAVDASLRVKTRPVKTARADDGWVIVGKVTPSTYAACDATFVVLVLLGADEARAEDRFGALVVPLVDALTKAGWMAALIPEEFGGSGLGLAIVREIAHGAGGEVEILDPPSGRGALLQVSLPAGNATATPPAAV